jgi:hypothetical protein
MWRLREGKSYFSMPTALWDEAVAAARKYPLRLVARELGVSRDDLKQRMGMPVSAQTTRTKTSEAVLEEALFIELPGVAQALTLPPVATEPVARTVAEAPIDRAQPTCPPHEAVLEVVTAAGDRLTLRFPAASLDVSSLIHHFRSRA